MIQREDTYSDFKHRIRNADSHEDAKGILRDLTPSRIEDTCKRLVQEQGDAATYDDSQFHVKITQWTLSLSRNNVVIYKKHDGDIVTFKPIECWNVLNFLEEIIDKGEIEI